MTHLGKPLVFYLKYLAEMNRLYYDLEEGEERDLTGLENPEQVVEMARTVGDAACEQVADFIAQCGKGIEDHFTGLGIATLANKSRRATVVRDWRWSAKVNISSVPGSEFWCGVYVTAPPEVHIPMENNACGIVALWLWSKGSRKAEDLLWQILRETHTPPHSRGGDWLFSDRGSVVLACIPIKPQPPESLDVDRDQLIAEVTKTIARIGVEETKAIARFVVGLNEPEEG
jgi:hypothetical protein